MVKGVKWDLFELYQYNVIKPCAIIAILKHRFQMPSFLKLLNFLRILKIKKTKKLKKSLQDEFSSPF